MSTSTDPGADPIDPTIAPTPGSGGMSPMNGGISGGHDEPGPIVQPMNGGISGGHDEPAVAPGSGDPGVARPMNESTPAVVWDAIRW